MPNQPTRQAPGSLTHAPKTADIYNLNLFPFVLTQAATQPPRCRHAQGTQPEAKQLSAKPSACAHSLTRKPRMRTFDDMSTATFFSAAVEPVFFTVSGRQNRKGVRTSGGTQARADKLARSAWPASTSGPGVSFASACQIELTRLECA